MALCTLADGQDVGGAMVEAELPLAYRRYGGAMYDAQERAANAGKSGLWAGEFIPPWEWRRKGR